MPRDCAHGKPRRRTGLSIATGAASCRPPNAARPPARSHQPWTAMCGRLSNAGFAGARHARIRVRRLYRPSPSLGSVVFVLLALVIVRTAHATRLASYPSTLMFHIVASRTLLRDFESTDSNLRESARHTYANLFSLVLKKNVES